MENTYDNFSKHRYIDTLHDFYILLKFITSSQKSEKLTQYSNREACQQ